MPPQTVIAQTLLLAFRVAFVWAGGILLAVACRALLPEELGFGIHFKDQAVVLAFNRLGFWTCIWAAVTVTILVVMRAMLADLGIGTGR